MRLSQGMLGIGLAIAILFFAGAATARYFLTRLSSLPPRPTFPNDSAAPPPADAAIDPAPPVEEAAAPVEPAEPDPTADDVEYQARVTVAIGLILRDGPSVSFAQVGGVEYNAQLAVLGVSDDGEWINVRLGNGSEGWVKSGNLQRIN